MSTVQEIDLNEIEIDAKEIAEIQEQARQLGRNGVTTKRRAELAVLDTAAKYSELRVDVFMSGQTASDDPLWRKLLAAENDLLEAVSTLRWVQENHE